MNVLVLMGGDSTEREVSLRSGAAVVAALKQTEHTVTIYDPKDGDQGLAEAVKGVDIVLPILHGDNGEDGVIQEKLEHLGVPYLGATSEVSRVCISKEQTHKTLERNGIKMAKYEIVNEKQFTASRLTKKPFVLKTADGGSSVDIVVARHESEEDFVHARALLRKRGTMLLEELIEGLEITVPVLGEEALPPIAIIPPEDGEFDYENKYNGSTQEIVPIPEGLLSATLQRQAQELALKVHSALKVRHLSRTDMIVTPEGEIYVLELNTIPGMTEQSLFPKSAAVSGLDMPALTEKFIQLILG